MKVNSIFKNINFWQFYRFYSIFQPFISVLGLTRDSPKSDVGKVYRKLAGKWHPDRFRDPEDKIEAEKKFMQIASA